MVNFRVKMPSNDANLTDDKDADVVLSVLSGIPFKLRPDDEKVAILQKGRPLVNLNVVKQATGRNSNRLLNSSWYSIYKWLCGSRTCNKFFCWPCLLMRPETSSWCSIGNDDTTRFSSLAAKHARCKSHLKAICEYEETLNSLNITPEIMSKSKFKCNAESVLDKTAGNDYKDEDNTFLKHTKENIKEDNCSSKVKVPAAEPSKIHIPSRSAKITFKTWQELYRDTFPVSKARFFQDLQIHKWKKKIAKQDLRNSRLMGEKLKFEIEVLKVKLEHYKALKQDADMIELSQPATSSSA